MAGILPKRNAGGGLLDFLSQIMPGPSQNPYGGLLSDDQYQQYRQQQMRQGIGRMGDFLMRASMGDSSGGRGRGGQGGLLQMMQMKQYQQGQQAEQAKQSQYQGLITGGSGFEPGTGVTWDQARPGNPDVTKGMTPQQRGLLGGLDRKEGMGLLAAQAFKEPAAPPAGFTGGSEGLKPIPGGPADVDYLGRKAEATRAPTERQLKINELKTRGFSQSQAEDVASGRVRVSTDPVTGAVRLINVATGRMTQPGGQSGLPKKTRGEMASQVQSIDGLLAKMPSLQEAIEKGVGFIPAAKEFGGKVLGQLPTGSVDVPGIGEIGTGEAAVHPEVVRARTSLRIFREDVIAAFRKSGKVPVMEQRRILEFIDKLGVLNSVPDAKLSFQQLEQELRRIRDTYDVQLSGGTPSNPYSKMSDQEVLELLRQQGHDIGQ